MGCISVTLTSFFMLGFPDTLQTIQGHMSPRLITPTHVAYILSSLVPQNFDGTMDATNDIIWWRNKEIF
jgi:hypothetical protein